MFLLVWPWLHPWSPAPQPNTLPLLAAWACWAALLLLGRWPRAHDLAKAWALAAVLSSALGLLQYFGQAHWLGGWAHVHPVLGEAAANLRQRNQLATLCSMGLAAVLWWHAHGLRQRHALWMLAVLALGNAATNSRTGLLQWVLLPLLLAAWHWAQTRRPLQQRQISGVWSWRLLAWALALYVLASWCLPQALQLALPTGQVPSVSNAIERMTDNNGCGSRRLLWANVLHLIGQKPWTGWGWGELKYAHYMADYALGSASQPRFCDILGNAHNLPLHMAFALGLPLTALALLALLWAAWRAQPLRPRFAASRLAWGVLLPLALHSLLEFPLWYGPFQLTLLWAVLLLSPRLRARLALALRGAAGAAGAHALAATHRRWRVQVPLLAALGLLALIAWDYQRVRQVYLPAGQRWEIWATDPWGAAEKTWFFGPALQFAQVTSTPVTPDNAATMLQAGLQALHYSPEPRVIDAIVKSADLLGQHDLANWHRAQKRKAYGPPPAP